MKRFLLLLLLLGGLLIFGGCTPGDTDTEKEKDPTPLTVSVYVDQTDEWLTATYNEEKKVLTIDFSRSRFAKEIGYYTLEGLYNAPEGGGKIYSGIEGENGTARLADGNAFSPNVRLYSKWKGKDYTVYFRSDDNKAPMHFMSNGTITWTYGATVTKLPTPTHSSERYGGRYNKPFAGWRNGNVLVTDEKGNVRAECRELLSSWYTSSDFGAGRLDLQPVYIDVTYRITYVLADGSEYYATVTKGSTIDFAAAPKHALGNTAVYGWSLSEEGDLVAKDLVPQEDMTLYAQYRRCKTVRFYSNFETNYSGAARYTEVVVFEGESLENPYPSYRYYASVTDVDPVRFPVRYDDIKSAYFRLYTPTGSSIVPTPCRIIYDTAGLNIGLTEVAFVQQTTFPLPTPTVTGYTFDGWYLEEDYSGKRVIGVLAGEDGTPQKYNGYYLRLEDETLHFVASETTLTLYGKFTPEGEGGGV